MGIFSKGSKFYSIFWLKCPTCHQRNLFDTGSFSFNRPFDMPDRCAHCRQSYMPEPGFYIGAMFISYIFTAFFSIGFVALVHWVFGWSITASFVALLAVFAILFVYFFRLARSIWLNINFHYQPERKL